MSQLAMTLNQHRHSQPHSSYGPLSLNMVGHTLPLPPAAPPSPSRPAGRQLALAPSRAVSGGSAAGGGDGGAAAPNGGGEGHGVGVGGGGVSKRDVKAAAAAAGGRSVETVAPAMVEAPAAPAETDGTAVLDGVRPRAYTAAEVFQCHEESLFYSQALEKLLPTAAARHAQRAGGGGSGFGSGSGDGGGAGGGIKVVEFGTGDGTPVISALMKTKFNGVVHGFELNPTSAGLAREHAAAFGLSAKYQIHTGCFYAGTSAADSPAAGAACLISNPPYLPSPDADILMPELHGGSDGAGLTRDLLSLGLPYAMLLVASYSNPVSVLRRAAAAGYRVADFLVTPLPFGTYSSQPKVRNWISAMRSRGEAFYSGNTYLLAGVLFEKKELVAKPGTTSTSAISNGSSNGSSNGHSSSGNGNGHNGNGHNGGCSSSLTVYHGGEEAKAAEVDEEDISPQLMRLLTAL